MEEYTVTQFHLNRKLIIVVSLFIVAASGLVVLTNTAINMMAANQDYSSLLMRWEQAHLKTNNHLIKYAQGGDPQTFRMFQDQLVLETDLSMAVTEFFEEEPDIKRAFAGFSVMRINPNEISTLLTIFKQFRDFPEIKKLRRTWSELIQDRNKLEIVAEKIHRQWQDGQPSSEMIVSSVSAIEAIRKEIPVKTFEMQSTISAISLAVKRVGLWISVILGILLVLTGVVFTVRGLKSINKWEAVLKERDFLASFPELNPSPVLQIDSGGRVNYANRAITELFPDIEAKGFDHPLLIGASKYFNRANDSDKKEYRELVEADGTFYLQSIHYIPSENGLHIHAKDITENIKQEQQIRDSLKEKEILLAEIHHRVKNNLAVISGLLEIQYLSNTDSKKALKESQSRIQSMATIHEILYQSESFSEIKFHRYIEKLVGHIQSTYINQQTYIEIHQDLEEIVLNINQAIPSGLILNELLANAIEHGFPDKKKGRILIKLKNIDDKVILSIKDNGKGLPNNFAFESLNSTGFTIINALSDQLEAEIEATSHSGAEFIITFPKSSQSGSGNANL